MKKIEISLTVILCIFIMLYSEAYAEDADIWKEKPTITSVYEYAKERIFLEWEGTASLYRVYVDGKESVDVNINNAIIDVKAGNHKIKVVPLNYEAKDVSTYVELNIGSIAGGSIDLGSLGVDPKDLHFGTPSETFTLDYTPNPLFNSGPQITAASTDFRDRVIIQLTDKFDADVYRVFIKSGKDTTYVDFDTSSEEDSQFIVKDLSTVSLVLDQAFLKDHECMRPELGKKYVFSVILRKWPTDKIGGAKEKASVLESKESKAFDFTPFAAWKYAPEITYHSQTADGQITLRWEHEDNGLGCEYQVIKLDKLLVVKKGQEILGSTSNNYFVVNDLMNGKHTFVVVPIFSGEEGFRSEEITEEIKNDWVVAPSLSFYIGDDEVKFEWETAAGVESYHVIVYVGNGSVLRFVNLDYKKYAEYDVLATDDKTEFEFEYDEDIDPDSGLRLKFDIYGIRFAANGEEQRSAASSQTVLLK